MIITITEVTQAFTTQGAEYLKVKGISDNKETTKAVFDNLKTKWELLQPNATLEFVMVKEGQFWNVADIKPVALPPPPKPTMLGQDQAEKPSGQEIGMTTKELGDMIRAKYLIPIFGNEVGTELIKWYRGRILSTTRIPYDRAKLPDLKRKEE